MTGGFYLIHPSFPGLFSGDTVPEGAVPGRKEELPDGGRFPIPGGARKPVLGGRTYNGVFLFGKKIR